MSDETVTDDTPRDNTPPDAPEDEPLVISLVRKEVPFAVTDKDGTTATYRLVELDGAERDKWVTEQTKKVKYDKGQAAGVTTLEGVQASLLSLCVRTDRNEKLSVQAIQKWPASAQNTLFKRAQRMNGLDKDGMDDAKKA